MRTLVLSSSLFRLMLAFAVLTAAHGCADITISRGHSSDPLDTWKNSAVLGEELSPRTRQTLRRWDLETVYQHDPNAALVQLHGEALKEPQPDLLFALAEINYHRGRQIEKQSCADSLAYYYLSAGYAYHFLFDYLDAKDGAGSGTQEIFDPRYRLACDLYNASLAKCIRAAQKVGRFDARHQLNLPACDQGGFTLSVVQVGFAWKPEEFGTLEFADDF
jgi:hypothetical protein